MKLVVLMTQEPGGRRSYQVISSDQRDRPEGTVVPITPDLELFITNCLKQDERRPERVMGMLGALLNLGANPVSEPTVAAA